MLRVYLFLVLTAAWSCCTSAAPRTAHILVHSGQRRLAEIAEAKETLAVSVDDLSSLLATELGRPAVVETDSPVLDLTTDLFQKPRLMLLAHIPSEAAVVPILTFAEVTVTECTDKACNEKEDGSALYAALTRIVPLESDAASAPVVQVMATGATDDVSIANQIQKLVHDATARASDELLEMVKGVPELKEFDLPSEAATKLASDIVALNALADAIPTLIEEAVEPQVLFLSLESTLQAMPTVAHAEAAATALNQIVERVIKSADEVTAGRTFAMVERGPTKEATESKEQPKETDVLSATARRMLQATPTQAQPAKLRRVPRQTVLWLCVFIIAAAITALVPLLSLTPVSDPTLASKLLVPAH